MWLNRFGTTSANKNRVFPSSAGWGVVISPAFIISLNQVQTNVGSSVGSAGGNEDSRVPSNRKLYMELQGAESSGGVQSGFGFHNPTSPSATLNASHVRFHTPNANPSAGTDEDWYFGMNGNTQAYSETSTGWAGITAGAPGLTGWAIDTIDGKIWVTMNGSYWLGGGNPATGSSPTLTVNLSNYTLYAQGYFVSSGIIGVTDVEVKYNYSNFGYTPPAGFDFNL